MFRGGELPRLLTMVVMLGVVALLMAKAKEARTWRWLTGESEHAVAVARQAKPSAAPVPGGESSKSTAQQSFEPDREELEALQEELEAVDDKTILNPEEMPAYWRLVRWQQQQSLAGLKSRARDDVSFRELLTRPEKYRGQLIAVQVHVRETAAHEDVDKKLAPPNVKRLYELWGWNSRSQPYFYLLVTPEVPAGMPLGHEIGENATFVGYFLKLMAYQDHTGQRSAAPLLIGKVEWFPTPNQEGRPSESEWIWPWVVGIVLMLLFALRWGTRWLTSVGRRPQLPLGKAVDEETVPVELWLEKAEDGAAPAAPEQDPDEEEPPPPWSS